MRTVFNKQNVDPALRVIITTALKAGNVDNIEKDNEGFSWGKYGALFGGSTSLGGNKLSMGDSHWSGTGCSADIAMKYWERNKLESRYGLEQLFDVFGSMQRVGGSGGMKCYMGKGEEKGWQLGKH